MTLRDLRLILAVAISTSMMANQTSAGFDVGILRAANRSAQENEPGGETSPLAGNNAPTISAIANRVIAINGAAIATFIVADKETPGDGLKVEVASDNPAVVDTQRLTLERQGGKQTLTVVPVPDAEGTATITVTVSDMDGTRTSTQFSLTATADLPYVPGEIVVRVRPGVPAEKMLREAKASAARSGASAAAAMAVGGGGFKDIRPLLMGSLESVGAHAAAAEGDPTEKGEGAGESLENLTRTHVLTFDSREDVQDLLEMYQREEGVESVELNDVYRLDYTANDPIYVDGYLWGLEKIRAGRAWDNSPRGDGVVVAVIDSGVAINHPDLTPNLWKNSGEIRGNRVDDDKNGYVDDVDGWDFTLNAKTWNGHGHGTHVAGTIAAVGNNREGVIGVAPKAKIMPLKVFSDEGVSNLVSSVNAIYYAANKGAKVINLSWGAYKTCDERPTLRDAIAYAQGKKAVVVAAAGNDNKNAGTHSPSNCPNVVSVAATDQNDQKWVNSNLGTDIDVSAPGSGIYSTYVDRGGYIYASMNGTSMAAPHVSGLVALIVSKFPHYTTSQIISTLENSSDDIGDENKFGHGRINAEKAVNAKPSVPSNPKLKDLSATRLKLTWSASSDDVEVKGYYVDVSKNSSFSSFVSGYQKRNAGQVTSLTIAGLQPQTKYYARVRAYDGLGKTSDHSDVVSDKTLADTTDPSAPTGVKLKAVSSSKLTLSWSASSDDVAVTGYSVDVSKYQNFRSFESGYNNKNVGNVTTLEVKNLRAKTRYYTRVRAYDAAGNISSSSATVFEETK